jgi:hypothetical protein
MNTSEGERAVPAGSSVQVVTAEILQAPADVNVLESLLKGDEVCKVTIRVAKRET